MFLCLLLAGRYPSSHLNQNDIIRSDPGLGTCNPGAVDPGRLRTLLIHAHVRLLLPHRPCQIDSAASITSHPVRLQVVTRHYCYAWTIQWYKNFEFFVSVFSTIEIFGNWFEWQKIYCLVFLLSMVMFLEMRMHILSIGIQQPLGGWVRDGWIGIRQVLYFLSVHCVIKVTSSKNKLKAQSWLFEFN